MATYVVLCNFTDQGIRNVKETTHRAEAVESAARKAGIALKSIVWTLGNYDIVCTFEAPDDKTMTSFGLSVGQAGNVRTQTLRAFSRDEMNEILSRVA